MGMANKYCQEAHFLLRLSIINSAIKVYDSFIENLGDGRFRTVIIMEYCRRGNLLRELERRSRAREYYSYLELKNTIRNLVDLLRICQENKFCHRDIKPENIFVSDDDNLKLGDFGESTTAINFNNLTVVGSPFYLSPRLRRAYLNSHDRVSHNPYKSDVYSLGLVFLYMATLKEVNQKFTDLSTLPRCLTEYLGYIENPYIKKIIKLMTSITEEERPDFIELSSLLNRFFNEEVCTICWNDCTGDCSKCNRCSSAVHYNCINTPNCMNCGQFYSCLNIGCNNLIEVYTNCLHQFCNTCRLVNIDCHSCIQLDLIEFENNYDLNLPPSFFCVHCNSALRLSDNKYVCLQCSKSYCRICKNYKHHNICLLADENRNVRCECGTLCHKDIEDLFFQCRVCDFKCIVCMKNSLSSHKSCSYYLQQVV
jgi:serine/threonine protein kinase